MGEGLDEAMLSEGTKFEITSESPALEIAGVVGFNGPDGSAQVIDATHLRSTAKEKKIGLRDEGSLSLELNYLPKDPGQAALQAARTANTKVSIRITLTDDSPATTATFDAYVPDFQIKGGVDEKVSATCKMEITGAVTWS